MSSDVETKSPVYEGKDEHSITQSWAVNHPITKAKADELGSSFHVVQFTYALGR